MAEFAPGIADKSVYGDVASELRPGDVTDFVLQHHDTVRRPGRPHYDLRLGTKDTNLFSWAVPRAELPGLGESRLAAQTQLHCLPGDTGIITKDGVEKISDIVSSRKQVDVLSYDEKTNSVCWKPIEGWWHRACDEPVLRIELSHALCCQSGATTLACTRGHKLPTPTGKISAGDLKVGDYIYCYGETLSKEQWQIVYGTLLGDGFIDSTHKSLGFTHCEKQREYAKHKSNSLSPIISRFTKVRNTGFGADRPAWRAHGPNNRPEIIDLYDNVYVPCSSLQNKRIKRVKYLIDRLSAHGLAIWYQDDGSRISAKNGRLRGASIATHGFLPEDVDYIVSWFKTKFGINVRKIARGTTVAGYKSFALRLNAAEARKLFAIIKQFVHPTMSYKIIDTDDSCRSTCHHCGKAFGKPIRGKEKPFRVCDKCLLDALSDTECSCESEYDKLYRAHKVRYAPRTYRLRFVTFANAVHLSKHRDNTTISEQAVSDVLHVPMLAKPVFAVVPIRIKSINVYSKNANNRFKSGLFNLTVKDTHTYIIENGIIVGNSHQYGSFQGRIPHGYGAGNVSMADKGKAIINKVTPNTVQFTLGHKKVPVRYTLVNTNPAKRQWLLVGAPRPGSVPGVGTKPVIKQIRAVDQDDAIEKAVEVQQKIDGASGVVNVGKGGDVEVYSANTSVSGEPIRHTERMGLFGAKVPGRYAGRSLRGELFFRDKKGRAIPFKDVSALLNALPANSIERQRASGYRPQIAVFDSINGDAQTRQELLDLLPKAVFTTPKSARTPEEKAELIRRIREGKDPDTSEGVILVMPDGSKIKVKNKEEATGYLTGTFPGAGKRKLAGGLTFKTPEGDEGRVGTGFTDAELADIVARIEELKGKQMRIEHLGRFGSGKLRAPSFRGFETDKVAEGQPQEKLRDATQDLDVDAGTEAFVRNGVKLAYEHGFGDTMSKLAGSRWRSDEKLPLVAAYPTRGAAGGLNGYRHRLLHDARVKLNRVNKLDPEYPDPNIRFPGFKRLMDAQPWIADDINPETTGQHLLMQNPKSVNEIKYLYRGHGHINPTAITPMSNGRIHASPDPGVASSYGHLDGRYADGGYTLRSTYKASPNDMYAEIDLKHGRSGKLRPGPRALKAARRGDRYNSLYETSISPDNEYIGTRISRSVQRGYPPAESAPITPRVAKAWASLTGQPQPTASQISQMTPALNTARAIRNTGAAAGKSFGEVTGIRPMYHAIRALPGQLRSGLPMYWQQAQNVGAKAIPATGAALAAAKGSLLAPAGAAIAASPAAVGALAAGAGAAGYGVGTVIDRTMGPTVNGEKQRLSEWYGDRLGAWYARRRGWDTPRWLGK